MLASGRDRNFSPEDQISTDCAGKAYSHITDAGNAHAARVEGRAEGIGSIRLAAAEWRKGEFRIILQRACSDEIHRLVLWLSSYDPQVVRSVIGS